MKQHIWSPTKDLELQRERGISFAAISDAIHAGGVCDILETHRPTLYPGQRRFILRLCNEIYVVPFRETDTYIVLITAWPDRKLRKRYLP